MRANFKCYSTSAMWKKMVDELGVDIDNDCQETRFNLPSEIGQGSISYFKFEDGLSLFLFNGEVHNDWEWQFQCERTSPFYTFFLLSGQLEDVKYNDDGEKQFQLNPMETLMVVQPGGSSRSIVFKSGEWIKVAVLCLKREEFLNHKRCGLDGLPDGIQLLLSIDDDEVKALFPPSYSTADTAAIVQQILNCEYEGLMRNCFVEAKSRELLVKGLQLTSMQFIDPEKIEKLEKVKMDKITLARDLLVKDLVNAPTIEELARMVGLNRQRLKTDFKMLYRKTIYQYLREKRLSTARKLLLNRNISIQEVAGMVGYENPSHFSRRFKEQFGMLPSQFIASEKEKVENN